MNLAILVHGAGGGAWEWESWVPEYRDFGWRTLAVEFQPAEGGLESTEFEDYVAQILDSIVGQSYDRVVLVGASMGGLIALRLAEELGPYALVLINPVPPKPVNWKFEKLYPPVIRWAGQGIEESRRAMPDCDEEAIEFAAARWRDESGSVLNAAVLGLDVSPPECKTLVIVGGRDNDIPPEVSLTTARWADAQVQVFHEMGHLGPLLGPDARIAARVSLLWLSLLDAAEG